MTAVRIDVSPLRINAHLSASGYQPDLVRRMRARGLRFERGHWVVPMGKVQQVAEELTFAGYDVLTERQEMPA